MRILKNLFIGLLFITVFSTSCKKSTNWDVDASFPIAHSYLNINNFFGDSLFVADTNNLLHFALTTEIINYTIDSLVKLPDTTIALPTYTASTSYSIYPGNQIYTNNTSSNKEITFDIANGVQLNKAIVKKGALKIEFSSEYDQPVNFKYTINSATLWGNMFQINQVVPGNANLFVKYYTLDGYTLDFTGQNFNKINTLVQTYTISADVSGQPSQINVGKGFSIKMS